MRVKIDRSKGFTIVELMIATTVFSVIILAITAAMTTISRAYQRSIYSSNTQAAASSLVDVLSQSIRSSKSGVQPGATVGGTEAYCIGNQQILYTIGRQISDSVSSTSSRYAVVTRPSVGCSVTDITVVNPALSNHKELLGKGMRLSRLTINQPTGTYYQVTLRVVYGDDDLICSAGIPDTCLSGGRVLTPGELKLDDLQCKQGIGSEYCSMSQLSSKIYQRF